MLGAGAVDYITKPFFLPELKARIRRVFRFKRIHDDFVAMKEDLIRERLATPFGDTRKIIPETLDDNVAVILRSLAEIRQAIQNINATVGNVDFLESTIMDLCARISNIMETATPAGKGQRRLRIGQFQPRRLAEGRGTWRRKSLLWMTSGR